MGDSYFTYDCIVAAQRYTNKVFVYYYDQKGAQSFGKIFGNTSLDLGMVIYLFQVLRIICICISTWFNWSM